MNGQTSKIPVLDLFLRSFKSVSTLESKMGINCSKIEKWNAGVKIFLIFFHFVPKNRNCIRMYAWVKLNKMLYLSICYK